MDARRLFLALSTSALAAACRRPELARESGAGASLAALDLRCEYLVEPRGIDVRAPRLSWKLVAADPGDRGLAQTAYEVLVASDGELLGRGQGDLWTSGRVESSSSVHVVYAGAPLRSRARCAWKVRVWDERGRPSPWSAPASWTMGLLEPGDWTARWIGAPDAPAAAPGEPPARRPDPWLRTSFVLELEPVRATAWVASLGYHELYANGARAGDAVLVPSVSDLSRRARTVTYDLTGLLHAGENALGLLLGSGWSSCARFGVEHGPLALAQVELELADGTTGRIATDASWRTHPSSITPGTPWTFWGYGGDRWDAGAELEGWSSADLDDSGWEHAALRSPAVQLSAEMLEPNRVTETLAPASIEPHGPADERAWRIDFGRSFTGWVELPLAGEPGSTVTVSTSERIEDEVSFNQRAEIVLPASGRARWSPRFNYASGRWVTVRGVSGPPPASEVRGHLIHDDYERLASFACSNELLNRIHDTVLWTFRCLSLGGYTVDCPHRERMGYGGDGQAMMGTALAHLGLGAFYTKWLEDWRDVQQPDGDLPYTAPTYEGGGGPAWSGIVVALPWELYVAYGDRRVLETTYPTMQRWLVFLDTHVDRDLLQRHGHAEWGFLGDWVPPGRDQGANRVDERSTWFFNNAYWLMSVEKVARIAEVIGKRDEAAVYRARGQRIRAAVQAEFYDPGRGTYVNGEQPYLALALLADLPPAELRPALLQRLEHEILVTDRGHVNAGIHGTYFLLEALAREDRDDLVFELATKTDYPSWGHMLASGATTIWEQWDGENSRLHASFLSIGAWFMRSLAGIRPDPEHPGYEHFHVAPALAGDLEWGGATYESIRGRIESRWRLEEGWLTLDVEVPPNTTATVHVPTADPARVSESGVPAGRAPGVISARPEAGRLACLVGSGRYSFRSPWR